MFIFFIHNSFQNYFLTCIKTYDWNLWQYVFISSQSCDKRWNSWACADHLILSGNIILFNAIVHPQRTIFVMDFRYMGLEYHKRHKTPFLPRRLVFSKPSLFKELCSRTDIFVSGTCRWCDHISQLRVINSKTNRILSNMTSITTPIYFPNQRPNQMEPFDQAGAEGLVNKTFAPLPPPLIKYWETHWKSTTYWQELVLGRLPKSKIKRIKIQSWMPFFVSVALFGNILVLNRRSCGNYEFCNLVIMNMAAPDRPDVGRNPLVVGFLPLLIIWI